MAESKPKKRSSNAISDIKQRDNKLKKREIFIASMIQETQTKNLSTLFVDVDGTLIATDTLWESVLIFLKSNPFRIIYLLIWFSKGKKYFKNQLAKRVIPNPALLPYRQNVLEFLHKAIAKGHSLVMATAAHRRIADSIARHLGIFSDVFATDAMCNLSGDRKLKAIQKSVGGQPFGYIGDGAADLPLWEAANKAIIIAPSKSLLKRARQVSHIEIIPSEKPKNSLRIWLKALRVHQWSKNLLLFVPAFLAHRIFEFNVLFDVLFAFISFSLCASSVYLLNDLLDLEADRQHKTKKNRPLACGMLSIKQGLITFPIPMIVGFVVAFFTLPVSFCAALALYLVLTTAYSFYLKSKSIVDVMTLASLYTFRILTGAVAVNIPISSWLLVFSMFFFMSLAFMKRYTDLLELQEFRQQVTNGRGYLVGDLAIVQVIGVACGYLSLLVFAMYVSSDHIKSLYKQPALLWLTIPWLFYWITRMWLLTHRGQMIEDPILFTIKDWRSYIIGTAVVAILMIATFSKGFSIVDSILLIP